MERNNSYEENMRVPILKSLRYEQCLILQKIEFSLNVIFPTYVNDDETSDAVREIINEMIMNAMVMIRMSWRSIR